jgi:mannose-6-phosphate isomerase-like protein (cupin superfamily)
VTNKPIRRVVTGHDPNGKAIVAMDGPPPVVVRSPLQEGLAFTEIWNTSSTPAPVDNGADPTVGRNVLTAPPKGGTIIRIVDMPPEGPGGPTVNAEQARALLASVGLDHPAPRGKARHPFMHRTQTVDYGVVLSGEIHLVLDDEEVHLKAGDVVVQRGTIHAWSNRGETVCRMLFVLIDGQYAGDAPR